MAYEIPGAYQVTFTTAADLRAIQYHAVKLDANGKIIAIAAITDRPLGILQDKPNLGEDGGVMLCGISYMKAGAAIAAAAQLGLDNTGRSKAIVPGTDTTQYLFGQVLEASGAANEIHTVVFDCRGCGRAA
jgi:hypothetical protein